MPELPRHLLLVDDDPVVLRLMAAALAPNHDLRFATSGEEALRSVRKAPPELILLDVEMPGLGGFAVCDALRADALLKSIPVIVVTSHACAAIEVAALAHGAIDFVTKPIVPALLASRVRAQLRASRLIERLIRGDGSPRRPAPAKAGEAARLLVVGTDPAELGSLRLTLESLGELHVADAGSDVLKVADRLQPDLILVSAGQPGIDGDEVCRRVRAEPAFEHLPVVFVSRFRDAESEVRALDSGASEYIVAPYTPGVLQARVRRLLQVKHRIDSQLREVAVFWRRVGDARLAEIVAAASDATPSHDAQGAIVPAHAAADRLLQAERSARVQMEAQIQAQRRMLSFIAHEMGNPLAGIIGFVQLMADDPQHRLPAAQARRLSHIATSTEHLRALLKDLGTLGRSERSDFALEFVLLPVQRAVEDAAAAVAGLAARAGVAVTCRPVDPAVQVWADAKRLHQCLLNLLTNAVKYNRPGGAVEIEVDAAGHASGSVGIAVRDNGQGMVAAQVNGLFQPFNRLGRQGSGQPGSGLGLVITRELLVAMNGRLTVESTAAVGSCFTIVMRLAEIAVAAARDTSCLHVDPCT